MKVESGQLGHGSSRVWPHLSKQPHPLLYIRQASSLCWSTFALFFISSSQLMLNPSIMKTINFKSPEHKRYLDEEEYHRRHLTDFRMPPRVGEQTNHSTDISFQLYIRQEDYSFSSRTLGTLRPEECLYFCCKDVAIYLNTGKSYKGALTGRSFFDAIYRHFFPHRDPNMDLYHSHFFSVVVNFKGWLDGGPLSEITRFHEALCQKVGALVPALKLLKDQEKEDSDEKVEQGKSTYDLWPLPEGLGLTPTFDKVFFVVEVAKSKMPDVLVVCRDEETARWLSLKDEDREHDPNAGSVGKPDPDPARAWPLRYRMGLLQAMDAIFSVDEKRRVGVDPDSCFWKSEITEEEQVHFSHSAD